VKRFALDTGPLVALLNRKDSFHRWSRDALDTLAPPLYTCESVLSEACFLLRHSPAGPDAVLALVESGVLRAEFRATDHMPALRKMMTKYRGVPMSFADACLVRMSESDSELSIVTLDSDFRVYRKHGRQVIPVVSP